VRKYLRLAFSAVCGIVCLLLIVLWVRSYGWVEKARGNLFNHECVAESSCGKILCGVYYDQGLLLRGWQFESHIGQQNYNWNNLWWTSQPTHFVLGFSYALPVFALAAISTIPWLPWSNRFSLRTLLIGMTLVAVLLGVDGWAMSQ
jgi:hypothetical protein